MKFIPQVQENLVSPLSTHEVFEKLKICTITSDQEVENRDDFSFYGKCEPDLFSIYSIAKRPNQFVPLIQGILTKEGYGTAIVLRYKLFNSTKNFLIFWTLITFLTSIFFAFIHHYYLYAVITISAGIVNYVLCWEKFKQEVRKSRRQLKKILQIAD